MPSSWRRGDADALADPRFLLGLGALLVNDHYLKAAYGNAVTGKVSDLAGLVVLPVIVTLALRLAGVARARDIALVSLGIWFTAMKTVPSVAALTETLFQAATGSASMIVVDPTDLVALPALLVARAIIDKPLSLLKWRPFRILIAFLAVGACLATSDVVTHDYDHCRRRHRRSDPAV